MNAQDNVCLGNECHLLALGELFHGGGVELDSARGVEGGKGGNEGGVGGVG
jgi:hypothetical protein